MKAYSNSVLLSLHIMLQLFLARWPACGQCQLIHRFVNNEKSVFILPYRIGKGGVVYYLIENHGDVLTSILE